MARGRRVRWPAPERLHTIVFDFDGVFTDNAVYVDADGREQVRCDRADGLALDWLRRYRKRRSTALEILIVSTERNPVVAARARKLKLTCRQGVRDKLAALTAMLRRRQLRDADPFKGLLFLGNDLNDLAVMRRAGFSVAPSDAHPLVRRAASAVLPQAGGRGFVRAAIERLLGVHDMSREELDEFVSHR
jgi:YrbI family 3-deoxy-D-manno-octulosonate 8-phosphate phosphatase